MRLERGGGKRLVPVDESMHVVQWQDKRIVSVLTTIHDDTPVPVQRRSRHAPNGQEVVEKPHAIVEYNKYMGGVDRGDQLLTYYIPIFTRCQQQGEYYQLLQEMRLSDPESHFRYLRMSKERFDRLLAMLRS